MAKVDEHALALAALARAISDPAPKPLVGTKAKPGVFIGGTAAIKACAQRCLDQGWLEPTGGFEGQGRTRKPLYRISTVGIAYALEHAPAAELLREMLSALNGQSKRMERIQGELATAAELSRAQTVAVQALLKQVAPPNLAELLQSVAASRPAAEAVQPAAKAGATHPAAIAPPNVACSAWLTKALAYLAEYRRRNPYGRCTLPELYQQAAANGGISIGQFHDGLRQLAAEGKIGLHPFTGAAYQLREEQYALVAGQEIKYYVDLVVER